MDVERESAEGRKGVSFFKLQIVKSVQQQSLMRHQRRLKISCVLTVGAWRADSIAQHATTSLSARFVSEMYGILTSLSGGLFLLIAM